MKKNVIKDMLKAQYELNEKTNGKDWIFGKTSEGKVINWPRCIFLEVAELIDSYPWKHWKNIFSEIDHENVVIELIDIWHFIMSYSIHIMSLKKMKEKGITSVESNKDFFEKNVLDDLSIFFERIYKIPFYEKSPEDKDDMLYTLYKYERIANFASLGSMREYDRHSEEFISENMLNVKESLLDEITLEFFECTKYLSIDIAKVYQAKNILNSFRQDFGYKEGSYKKMWLVDCKEQEDNKIMISLLENVELEDLYGALKVLYNQSF